MDILSYLTTLIKSNKEVGIPGLGTIYKRKSPGRYDTETHSFLPPSYTLAFTSDLKEQELLTAMVAQKKSISADAATYFVEQFAQNILDELAKEQEADFGELGTFTTQSGSLTFIPKQDQQFGFDFYGLPVLKEEQALELEKIAEEAPVSKEQLELENDNADLSDGSEITEEELLIDHLDSTEEEQKPLAEETIKDVQPVYPEIAEVQNERQKPVFEPLEPANNDYHSTVSEEKSGMPFYLKVSIALFVILAIGVVAYMINPNLFRSETGPDQPVPDTTAYIKQNDQTDSIARADSIRISNEKAIMAIDSVKDTLISYDIIAASLLNQKEADRFLADMKKRGIPAKVAKMRGKRIKISIGSFLDEDTAKKELEILKKTTKIPGIYIIPIRHTNNPK